MIHLRSLEISDTLTDPARFPFNLPMIRETRRVEFETPVTFFVGENGSGKSTLLEAMAAAIGSVAVGGDSIQRDETLAHARELGRALKLVWNRKTRRGFFLRAEDFFRFARRMAQLAQEMADEAKGMEEKYSGYGLLLAKGALMGERAALVERYGEDLDANSHGESFLHIFQSRFVPGGLYLLDEPETPLSPQRQLALLSMIKQMIEEDAQFVIATHSPILMAFPGATIVSFDEYPLRKIAYEDVEHVNLTRDFLKDPERFLRHL